MDAIIQIALFLLTAFNLLITFKEGKKYIIFIRKNLKEESNLRSIF